MQLSYAAFRIPDKDAASISQYRCYFQEVDYGMDMTEWQSNLLLLKVYDMREIFINLIDCFPNFSGNQEVDNVKPGKNYPSFRAYRMLEKLKPITCS